MSVMEAYAAKRARVERLAAEVQKLSAVITNVGKSLSEAPLQFAFGNAEPALPIPQSASSKVVHADRWKSVVQIQQMLHELHEAMREMREAWEDLSPDQKACLAKPVELGRVRHL